MPTLDRPCACIDPYGRVHMSDEVTRSAHFRFATDILRRLGEELNPSVDQGILELVKNAYDADAHNCAVKLSKTVHRSGTITVTDDGVGMTEDDILDGWLILGRSRKSARSRTRLNRTPAGSKGLGRLAALRLGRSARLVSRPAEQPSIELDMEIDWDKYDEAAVVEEVNLTLHQKVRAGGLPGSEITLQRLREPVGRNDVKRLARAMILLADPFGDDPTGFKPVLQAQEFKDLERLVRNRYFTDADFHLRATLDEFGIASAEVLDWRGQVIFSGDHDASTLR